MMGRGWQGLLGRRRGFWAQVALVLALWAVFELTDEGCPGLRRRVQKEELWLYRFPHMESYWPSSMLWFSCFALPICACLVFFGLTEDSLDLEQGLLGSYFSLWFCGVITNVVKLIVGRPRPDFLERCYPGGEEVKFDKDGFLQCSGDWLTVNEGYKSFPSGHSALTFSCFAFVALYLAGKLHVFEKRGQGQVWRLVVASLPVLGATCVALSRTIDYHHHWQDVLVGSLLGLTVATLTYFQYYPPLTHPSCDQPLRRLLERGATNRNANNSSAGGGVGDSVYGADFQVVEMKDV